MRVQLTITTIFLTAISLFGQNKPIVIEPDYWNMLLQWVVFFGFMVILVLPALLYKKLARKFNKKGWLYFILGLIVGLIGLTVVHLYARVVNHFTGSDLSEGTRYSWLLSMYLVGYLYVWAAYKILLSLLNKQVRK